MNELALDLQGVGITYPHFTLKDINIQLERGSILGLIGPNGAGKSTTIRILMGLLLPDTGKVNVLGHDMTREANKAKWKIGYASDDLRLYKNMTVEWHMQFIARMFKDWDQAYAEDLLRKFDLRSEQKVKGLSHGQRVKASLLLILARRPELLVLDEPTTGLDPVARQETLNEMMEVLLDEHRSIVFSSHNTADVEQLSDQITFIDRGHVVNSNDKETFLEAWRRVRLTHADASSLARLNGCIDQRVDGHSVIVTTNQYSESLINDWKTESLSIDTVERMTLEEIFVAEVMNSRGENHQVTEQQEAAA